MPTLRVWIFTEKVSAQEYWKRNTADVPGYGRVQAFQKTERCICSMHKNRTKIDSAIAAS